MPVYPWKMELYSYVIENATQYVFYHYDYDENDQQALLPYCANIPVSELKTLTYKATPAPKGFFENFIEPNLEKYSSNYDWDSETNSYIQYESRKVYDKIASLLEPENTVIIKYVDDDYSVSGRSLLIQVKRNNELIPVVYKENGHWYPFDRDIPRNRKTCLS